MIAPCVGTTGKWYRHHTPTRPCPKALGFLVITGRTSYFKFFFVKIVKMLEKRHFRFFSQILRSLFYAKFDANWIIFFDIVQTLLAWVRARCFKLLEVFNRAVMLLLVMCYDKKRFMSPYIWVIYPLTQPQVAYQQKKLSCMLKRLTLQISDK